MGLWSVICAAGAVVIVVLTGKIILLYRDLEEIGAQFDDRLERIPTTGFTSREMTGTSGRLRSG